ATLGTAIVAITYLLGRRMSGSRLVGAIAGAIILCDGMYLVDSRYAVIDIVYLTCAAVAYLLFFRFAQTPDAGARRRILPWIGLALGLCLASKFYIPAITFLLVTGFILYVLARDRPNAAPAALVESKAPIDSKAKKIKAAAPAHRPSPPHPAAAPTRAKRPPREQKAKKRKAPAPAPIEIAAFDPPGIAF